MSLLRLLTAGQCLDGLKQPASVYRLSDQRALPKFGSERNPLARVPVPTSTKGDPARTQSQGLITENQETTAERTRVAPTVQAEDAIGSGIKNSPTPVAAKQDVRPANNPTAKMARPRSGRKLLDFGRTWAGAGHLLKSARNFLPGNMQAQGESKSRISSPRMLQGELLLENIKVMRNDLSDADWEIVTKKETKRAVAPEVVVAPMAQIKASESAWGRMSTRLFGAGKL